MRTTSGRSCSVRESACSAVWQQPAGIISVSPSRVLADQVLKIFIILYDQNRYQIRIIHGGPP